MSNRYRGRPSSLTDETKENLFFAIRRGLTLRASCDHAGISYQTLRNWINIGEAELARVEEGNGRRRVYKRKLEYVLFVEEYEEAIAESEVSLAEVVKLSADGGHVYTEKSTKQTNKLVNGKMETVEEVTTETVKTLQPDWRAALAMLERRFPERWALKHIIEGGNPDKPIRTAVNNKYRDMDEDDLNDELRSLLNRYDIARESTIGPNVGRDDPPRQQQEAGNVGQGQTGEEDRAK